jgi:hypothetical protein
MSSKSFIACGQCTPVSRSHSASKIARAVAVSLCLVTIACAAQTPPVPGPGCGWARRRDASHAPIAPAASAGTRSPGSAAAVCPRDRNVEPFRD